MQANNQGLFSLKPGPAGMTSDGRFGAPETSMPFADQSFAGNQPMFDVELGRIFLRMRTLLGISLWDMARLVGGEPTVIANLEAGAISALPPWPELTRLIDAYASHTGIDPQPILSRLLRLQPAPQAPTLQHLEPGPLTEPRMTQMSPRVLSSGASGTSEGHQFAVTYQPPQSDSTTTRMQPNSQTSPLNLTYHAAVTTAPPRTKTPRSIVNAPALATLAEVIEVTGPISSGVRRATLSTTRGFGRLARRNILSMSFLLLFPAGLLLAARFTPTLLYGVVSPLPALIGAPLHGGINYLVGILAPVRDGLTWIDIDDPRARKSDKLPEHGR
jgi:hypothetical protein